MTETTEFSWDELPSYMVGPVIARIHYRLLEDLNAAGLKLLGYIIDEAVRLDYWTQDGKTVKLDKVAIVNYYESHHGPKYATTINVNRGIKELIAKGVIAPTEFNSVYLVNNNYLQR